MPKRANEACVFEQHCKVSRRHVQPTLSLSGSISGDLYFPLCSHSPAAPCMEERRDRGYPLALCRWRDLSNRLHTIVGSHPSRALWKHTARPARNSSFCHHPVSSEPPPWPNVAARLPDGYLWDKNPRTSPMRMLGPLPGATTSTNSLCNMSRSTSHLSTPNMSTTRANSSDSASSKIVGTPARNRMNVPAAWTHDVMLVVVCLNELLPDSPASKSCISTVVASSHFLRM
mmetsp:Transcript_142993/g.456901  ORF Transcript_142993/g.456901 Transcript_142993/m.456901 type:complete len:230 (-) Transcript_142993:729-1418(-)